jgi:hypothetical protein
MTIHKLKTNSKFKPELLLGVKTFDIRLNDRNFQRNDDLLLEFIDDETKQPTGEILSVKVAYILQGGQFGIDDDCVVMAITLNWFSGLDFHKDFN